MATNQTDPPVDPSIVPETTGPLFIDERNLYSLPTVRKKAHAIMRDIEQLHERVETNAARYSEQRWICETDQIFLHNLEQLHAHLQELLAA